MFKKIFKKNQENIIDKNVLVAALLIHAAKIDENYTSIEKEIIKKALMNLSSVSSLESEKILKNAEEKESESNQIIESSNEPIMGARVGVCTCLGRSLLRSPLAHPDHPAPFEDQILHRRAQIES